MNQYNESPGVLVANAQEVEAMETKHAGFLEEIEGEVDDIKLQSSLAGQILQVFQDNKDARTTSGMDRKLLQSLRAYNGHYDPEDRSRIAATGGSDIYMNITPTKCRAAMSWIRDILMPAQENAWSLSPTPLPQIPQKTKDQIMLQINKFVQEEPQEVPQAQGPEGQPGQPQQPVKNSPVDAASKLQETYQLQKDLEEAIEDEIYKLAHNEVKKYETKIADELAEGQWDKALSEFIEDFCVFQVAVMKGPIITKRRGITWKSGKPVPIDDYVYLNKRISPLDIYPSPSATCIQDGNLCEHIRMGRKELYDLIGTPGYKEDHIRTLLEMGSGSLHAWLDSYIEDEKVLEEYRGDTYRANKDIYHGLHYFGTASWQDLFDWGYPEVELGADRDKEFDIEALLVGDHVIKCEINDDPMLRRPYYKASFQNIPGSWWGRSLPELMRDIQRLCNATARALANNMGIASGPQVEVNIDRLAADEEIESMYPWKLWQTTNDPSGGNAKAVTFFQPSSNAGELLKVYQEFEVRADDATGIPRYAYGNERTGGAAQTASGLGMLLESASKGIKDAIRHIDDGLIKPRIEYQFYWDLMTDPEDNFTGDIKVVPKGSHTLTTKGAQELRRNEFLQILSAPHFQQIVGIEGLAEILREMSKSLGLGDNIIPSRVELRYKQKKAEEAAKAAQDQEAQIAQQSQATGVKQVELQTQQAEMASQRSAQLKAQEMQFKAEDAEKNRQIRAMELQITQEAQRNKETTALQKEQMKAAQKDRSDNKSIALSIESNHEDKSNK